MWCDCAFTSHVWMNLCVFVMQVLLSRADLDASMPPLTAAVVPSATAPAPPPGLTIEGAIMSFGPAGLVMKRPVSLQLGLSSGARRVLGLDPSGNIQAGVKQIIIHKYVAKINPNTGDPAPLWMPVGPTEEAEYNKIKVVKSVISSFSMYAPMGANYANIGSKGTVVGPYGQTPTSAGKEIWIGFTAFGVILMLMYIIVLLPSWAREPPPPPPPPPPPAPAPAPQKQKILPPPALPLSKPSYVEAEPVRLHHGASIKHFGPTFDDIFDKDDLNWWAQEEAKAEYKFPKLALD